MTPWSEALKRTAFAAVVAVIWGAVTYFYSELFFWWLSPVLTGLILAPALIRFSSSLKLGEALGRVGLFAVPSEVARNPLLSDVRRFDRIDYPAIADAHNPVELIMPREIPAAMPEQSFREFGTATLTLDMNIDMSAEPQDSFDMEQGGLATRQGRRVTELANQQVEVV